MRNTTHFVSAFTISALLLGLVACGGGEPDSTAKSSDGPPVVVMVAIDGLRTDAVGSHGGASLTPKLDSLAAGSVRFEWAFAQAAELWTSMASVLSGLYPTTNGKIDAGAWMADEAATLAEVLREAGWSTAGFLEGDADASDFGVAQGFSTFEIGPDPGAAALQWMSSNAGQPMLVVVGGWSAAAIDVPADEADPAQLRARYEARVQAVDEGLGALMTELDALGWADRTTLVVMGTNGAALAEHEDLLGESVYAPVSRVPLLIRSPGMAAGEVSKVVELVDLMPTLLEIVGVAAPAGLQGSSLIPVIEDRGTPPYIAFGESRFDGGQSFAALAGYQIVQRGEAFELYNMVQDPLEQHDLAGEDDKRVKVLQQHLEAWQKLVAATSLDPELRTETLDEDTVEQLKSLGYIQ